MLALESFFQALNALFLRNFFTIWSFLLRGVRGKPMGSLRRRRDWFKLLASAGDEVVVQRFIVHLV
jgi:hypothetical protein